MNFEEDEKFQTQKLDMKCGNDLRLRAEKMPWTDTGERVSKPFDSKADDHPDPMPRTNRKYPSL